jgi:hypothetical protein
VAAAPRPSSERPGDSSSSPRAARK